MSSPALQKAAGPGLTEFVLLVSAVMMTVALAIDSMLPALPAIGSALGVADENQRQFVISAFLAGFGISQLVSGTLSDRFGRRGLLLIAVFGYTAMSLAAALAQDFEQLLAARALQGMMAASAQIVIRSVVRDRFAGREMAQVMSLASTIFMFAPILAPAMGQLVLELGPWRWIFGILSIFGLLIWFWALLRLPETLAQEMRIQIRLATIVESARIVATDRMSLGYSIALAIISCSLYGFLLSVQQIFEHVLHAPERLPLGFAVMASGMAAASLGNAAIVKRFGMRLIGHCALIYFALVAAVHLGVALSGHETLVSFILLQTAMMLGFSFTVGNFSAMAMENMGGVAGMANSLQGSLSNVAGIVFGTLIGQSFDGTTVPLYTGYFVSAVLALAVVFVTEGGRFFTARHAPIKEA